MKEQLTAKQSTRRPLTIEEEILQWIESRFGVRSLEAVGLKLGEETGELQGEIVRLSHQLKNSFADADKEAGDILIVLSQYAAIRGKTLEQLRRDRFEAVRNREWKPEVES